MARKKEVATTLQAPNGKRVTMRDVYSALYELDKGLSLRFTSLQDSINGLHERQTTHEQGHVATVNQTTTKDTSTAKRAGLVGALVAVVAGIFEALRRTA